MAIVCTVCKSKISSELSLFNENLEIVEAVTMYVGQVQGPYTLPEDQGPYALPRCFV